jgi:hypothetical protein
VNHSSYQLLVYPKLCIFMFSYVVFSCLILLFWGGEDRVSPHSTGLPGTHYVAQLALNL